MERCFKALQRNNSCLSGLFPESGHRLQCAGKAIRMLEPYANLILRRTNESFCFSNGSIGNFFFAGARIFFQSLDAAIFLFSRVSQIPTESLVLPVISTNDRLTLGCELWDGMIIRGQNEISHPTSGSLQLIDKASQYINTVFVPKDGQIPVDIKCLAAQGIVHVVRVESMHDPKVGVVYEPTALIQALGELLSGITNKIS
ncbi:LPPG:FO 2-phospho-L-lactate transferase CofD/UPF0052 [Cynara cardunculus var. scolymus]|uniref:LPPG:FO 2-phospho-L-lactate transferase CofD/UPF0052 n=1 Tax=Cynara cardunculus var. scolymus TaxID=59895 RepID=A0A103XEY6_CYNCS|nr:LPPG:FO 2-phospho-L-lactate transferase CofD/UPF0052 [Cynara cardunculus var. scolymus]